MAHTASYRPLVISNLEEASSASLQANWRTESERYFFFELPIHWDSVARENCTFQRIEDTILRLISEKEKKNAKTSS